MSTEIVHNLLQTVDEITAIVGERIFYDELPSGQVGPAIVLEMVTDTRGKLHKKAGGRVDGVVRINCFAPKHTEANDLGKLLIANLNGYRGEITVNESPIKIEQFFTPDARRIPVVPASAEDIAPVRGVVIDATLAYHETATTFGD